MSEFKNLLLEVENEIAVLTISRPAALNALNSETLDELNVALTEIEARDDVKVLILTGGPGTGKSSFMKKAAKAAGRKRLLQEKKEGNQICTQTPQWWKRCTLFLKRTKTK